MDRLKLDNDIKLHILIIQPEWYLYIDLIDIKAVCFFCDKIGNNLLDNLPSLIFKTNAGVIRYEGPLQSCMQGKENHRWSRALIYSGKSCVPEDFDLLYY